MYADVANLFELVSLVKLVVVGVNGASESEARRVIGIGEGVKVDFERV